MSKIRLNPLQYLLGFALAKVFGEPLDGIVKTFGVITTTFSAFSRVAGWHDIVGCVPPASRDGNKVVHRQGMPESARATTIGAFVVEILKAILPVGAGKLGGKRVLLSIALMFASPSCFANPFDVGALPGFAVFDVSGLALFIIPPLYFPALLTMSFVVSFFVFKYLHRVEEIPLSVTLILTRQTEMPNAVRRASALSKFRVRLPGIAPMADATNRQGQIDHDVSLSSNLKMSSAGGEISRFSGISLADNSLFYRITRLAATITFSTRSNA